MHRPRPAPDPTRLDGSGSRLPRYPFVPPPELASTEVRRHPIVIVGGGLTGLTLAARLAQLGQAAVLLEEGDTAGMNGTASRGICCTQKSLEIFERLGGFERIAARGVQWSVDRTFAGDEEVCHFDLAQQPDFQLSQQPPFMNLQRCEVEAFLVERIAELGQVNLRWCSRVVGFEQNAEVATLTVTTPAGEYRIEAEHVIDAGSAHSPLREWPQLPFTGAPGDDRWCIAEVRFATPAPAERRTWIAAPFNDHRTVWQIPLADGVWRIAYQMPRDSDPAAVGCEEVVRERLARHFGPGVPMNIVWTGAYTYRNTCVNHMRAGRVFFMGDAATDLSPLGTHGSNSGIADADNLAWKLAAVLRGQAAPKLLDSYHTERHQAATENAIASRRTLRFVRPSTASERLFRHAALTLARQQPFARALVNTGHVAVAHTYRRSPVCAKNTPHAGASVPNAGLLWADRSPGTLNDLLRWANGRLLLLVFGALSSAACERLTLLSCCAPLISVQVLDAGSTPRAREHVLDAHPQGAGRLQAACHVRGPGWALVRPDAYLAANGESVDAGLVHAIEMALAVPTFL